MPAVMPTPVRGAAAGLTPTGTPAAALGPVEWRFRLAKATFKRHSTGGSAWFGRQAPASRP